MALASLARNQQQHEETLDVVRRTASEQIPFNIQKACLRLLCIWRP